MAIENKNLQFQYESKSGIKQNMFILSVYMLMTGYGTYHPMTSVEKVLLYRVDRILSILSTEESESTFMNLEEWFDSSSNVINIPIQLHVLLTTEGVRQCKSVPYLEEFVVVNEDGTGYIHSTIDKGEINFITPLFYRLGKDAQVLEPTELINSLRIRAKEILHMYEDEKAAKYKQLFSLFVTIDEYQSTNDIPHSYFQCYHSLCNGKHPKRLNLVYPHLQNNLS